MLISIPVSVQARNIARRAANAMPSDDEVAELRNRRLEIFVL